LSTLRSSEQATSSAGDPHDFYDPGQLLFAAWDVWLSTHAGAQHVQRVAEQRLRNVVTLARERAPFYRDLYRGLPAAQCQIEHLPVVRKGELMAHFDAAVIDPRVTAARVRRFLEDERLAGHPLLDRYAVWVSSGTTGEPGVFVHDGRALAVYEVLQAIRFRHAGFPTPLSAVFLATDRYALIGATGGHFAGNASVERLRFLHPWLADRVRTFSILDPTATLTRRLNEYRPTLVATYPTAASLLAEEQRAGRLAIKPREVWTGGEQLSSAQRADISEAFCCRVRDDYGASEFLSIAWDCGRGALHVNADWVILEPVDERYHRVPAGVASHTVLITNLANRVLPLIRYDLGDSVTLLDRPCECGSQLPAIRVEGRCDDVLAVTDATGRTVKLLPLALTTVLEDQAGAYRFQLIQVDATTLLLRLDPHSATAASALECRRALGRFLQARGATNVQVDVERQPLQPHPVSGKLRRVVAVH